MCGLSGLARKPEGSELKLLLDNLSLKIVALLLGLLLWFHVATEKIYTYEVRLPVTQVNLDQGLALVRYPVDSVTVVVSGSGKRLGRLQWREDGLRLNATQFTEGKHQLPLSPSNLTLIGGNNLIALKEVVAPGTVDLHIDRKAEVTLTVETDIVAETDDGFAVGAVSAPEPARVKVSGPRSVVARLKSLYTEHRRITGLRNNVDITVPLALPFGYGLSLEPDSVSLSIQVVPVRTRMFEGIPVMLFNTPADSLVSFRPRRISVVLTGAPDLIDTLSSAAIVASADYLSIDSVGQAAISIDCPAAFKVKSISHDSVSIIGF